MATAQDIINSARYDLNDYQTGIEFDDTELLNYLNRMIGVMDAELASLNSDLVEAEELTIDCVANQNYVDLSSMNSGLWDSLRSVWIGDDQVYKIGIDYLRYKRHWITGNVLDAWDNSTTYSSGDRVVYSNLNYRSLQDSNLNKQPDVETTYWTLGATGKPQYYALSNRTILFDYPCASAYTNLAIYYNKKSATLTVSSNMPYNDSFNETFREALVLHAKAKKEDRIQQGDVMWSSIFRRRAISEEIRRGFDPKPYYIDF